MDKQMTEQEARKDLANYIVNQARKRGSHIVGGLGYCGGLNILYENRKYSFTYLDTKKMETVVMFSGSRKQAIENLMPMFVVEQ